MAGEGAAVVVSARTLSEIEEVSREIGGRGQRALAVQADVSCEEDVTRTVKQALETFGRVDILVNNAGTNLPDRNVADLTLADWNRVLQVNLTGPFLCSRAVLPAMMKQNSGKIINISSIGGRFGRAGRSPYRTAKAGLLMFTECLAGEVKRHGIDVNAICVGPTNTSMMQAIGHGGMHPGLMRPEEIAALVVFLASPDSSAITGAVIDAFGPNNPIFR